LACYGQESEFKHCAQRMASQTSTAVRTRRLRGASILWDMSNAKGSAQRDATALPRTLSEHARHPTRGRATSASFLMPKETIGARLSASEGQRPNQQSFSDCRITTIFHDDVVAKPLPDEATKPRPRSSREPFSEPKAAPLFAPRGAAFRS
jgi:hypothetical protein